MIPKFLKAGINCCELKYEGCKMYTFRTFAHSLRRRFIDEYLKKGDVEGYEAKMREVIWACQPCHSKLDANKSNVIYDEVRKVITERSKPVI